MCCCCVSAESVQQQQLHARCSRPRASINSQQGMQVEAWGTAHLCCFTATQKDKALQKHHLSYLQACSVGQKVVTMAILSQSALMSKTHHLCRDATEATTSTMPSTGGVRRTYWQCVGRIS